MTIKINDDVWIGPGRILGTLEGFERVDGGTVYSVFVPDEESREY